MRKPKYNYGDIQKYYDSGKTAYQCCLEFGISTSGYARAVRYGKIINRSISESQKLSRKLKPRTHTIETRKKMSKIRKEYLLENPDKVPYLLNHYSKGPSYAEKYWKEVLDNNTIQYAEQHRIGLYSLDFAILDKKIDLEIDGEQHYSDDRIFESDIRRTTYLENLGWKIVRIRWSQYMKTVDKTEYVKSIIEQITNNGPAA